jgi:hypothetical protein
MGAAKFSTIPPLVIGRHILEPGFAPQTWSDATTQEMLAHL